MRKIVFVIFCTFVLVCKAQNVSVKTFEIEPFIGATLGTSSLSGYNHQVGPSLGLEGRWNLKAMPLDLGVQLYVGSAVYDNENVECKDKDVSCRTVATMFFIDYNFERGTNISPFVGLGVGVHTYNVTKASPFWGLGIGLHLYNMVDGDYNHFQGDNTTGIGISPRVGIEFFRRLRVTLIGHFGNRIYNTAGLSIGYSFGVGKKLCQNYKPRDNDDRL